MKSRFQFFSGSLLAVFFSFFGSQTVLAQLSQQNITTNPTLVQILQTLNGGGLELFNPQLNYGDKSTQIALFTNAKSQANLGMDKGVLFSSGNALFDLTNTNQLSGSGNTPYPLVPVWYPDEQKYSNSYDQSRIYRDSDLVKIVPNAIYDAVSFEFDVKLNNNTTALRVAFQFGSEEYPDYVGSSYNDAYGFFVSGPGINGVENMAQLPTTKKPVTINNVNSGVKGVYSQEGDLLVDLTQSDLYIRNGHAFDVVVSPEGEVTNVVNNTQPGPFPVNVEFNGLTKLITYELVNLVPGGTYKFKIAIADAGDYMYDAGVFIDKIQGTNGADVSVVKTVDNETPTIGDIVEFTLTAKNIGPYTATAVEVKDLLPSGFTYLSASAASVGLPVVSDAGIYDPVTGIWSIPSIQSIFGEYVLKIKARVNPSGDYTNTASITSFDPDPDPTNNTSSVTLVPKPAINFSCQVQGETAVYAYDFGSGSYPGAALASGITNLNYVVVPQPHDWKTALNDGQYTIVNKGTQAVNDWSDISDHTQGPGGNGYFMAVNADINPTEFFKMKIDGLCPNTKYTLSVWLVTMNSASNNNYCNTNEGGLILPNVSFSVVDGGNNSILGSGSSGDIPYNPNAEWQQYTFVFVTGAVADEAIFVLKNNAPGGCGNDIGIDDIEVFACSEQSVSFEQPVFSCFGDEVSFKAVSADPFPNTDYQWQFSTDQSTWIALDQQTQKNLKIENFQSNNLGYYRLLYSASGNINAETCRFASEVFNLSQESCPKMDLFKEGKFNDENGDGMAQKDETITYTFTLKNSGTTDISHVVLEDDLFKSPNQIVGIDLISGDLNDNQILELSETWVYQAVYSITKTDVEKGGVYNLAIATGKDPKGKDVPTTSKDPNPLDPNDPKHPGVDPTCKDCTITALPQNPKMDLEKVGRYVDEDSNGKVNPGDVIQYSFSVKNSGNLDLSNIKITDEKVNVLGGPIDLAVGATDATTFTANYVITQADIDKGGVFNLALAKGEDPNGNEVTTTSKDPNPLDPADPNHPGVDPSCADCTITALPQDPKFELEKHGVYEDTNSDGVVNVGDRILYVITVKNTGNVTLKNVKITDPKLDGFTMDLTEPLLAGTEYSVNSIAYDITQADIDAGGYYNLATVIGEDPKGNPTTTTSTDPNPLDPTDPIHPGVDPNCLTCTVTPLLRNPKMELKKEGTYVDVDNNGIVSVGDRIDYVFAVKNTGNVSLKNIYINDNLVTVNGGPINLGVGERDTHTFKASYAITDEDIAKGAVYNLATAEGKTSKDEPVTATSKDPSPLDPNNPLIDPTCPDCTITVLPGKPGIALVKTAVFNDENSNGFAESGETISYTFTVTNTGSMPLEKIALTDAMFTASDFSFISGDNNANEILEVNETWVYTATYKIKEKDLRNKGVTNTALVVGSNSKGTQVRDTSGTSVDNDTPTVTPLKRKSALVTNPNIYQRVK